MDSVPAGWYRDPYRQSGLRYWDGSWTDHTDHGIDPLNDAPQLAPPVVAQPARLSAESVHRAQRADTARRIAIAVVVVVVGVLFAYLLTPFI